MKSIARCELGCQRGFNRPPDELMLSVVVVMANEVAISAISVPVIVRFGANWTEFHQEMEKLRQLDLLVG